MDSLGAVSTPAMIAGGYEIRHRREIARRNPFARAESKTRSGFGKGLLSSRADIRRRKRQFRFGTKQRHSPRPRTPDHHVANWWTPRLRFTKVSGLLDDSIGAGKQRGGHGQA